MDRFRGDPVRGLEPRFLWEHFRQISQIPRCSGDEGKVREYVIQSAKRSRLEYKIDRIGNIRIRKRATEGFENRPSIALQAHLDMVCEKTQEASHDFSVDPIQLRRVNSGWIGTSGTTLGADNGIGVAASLAILESPGIKHGPLEVLLTTNEENGQTGAKGISRGMLKSRILVNLDSEEDDVVYAGCAGSRTTKISLALENEPKPAKYRVVQIELKGLKGGHSGLDIDKGRGNAIKLLNRFLLEVDSRIEVRLASFEGGSRLTAIPREARAVLFLASKEVSYLKRVAANQEKTYRDKFKFVDPDLVLKVAETGIESPKVVFARSFQNRLLNLLLSLPHGPETMSSSLPGLVQTSTNLAVVKMESQRCGIGTKQRSSVESEMIALSDVVEACGRLAGGEVQTLGDYPPWTLNLDSMALKRANSVYQELFHKKPQTKTMHAGLECAILGKKFPGMDMISIGPRIQGAHSPDEKVQIASVGKFWEFLGVLLSRLGD